MNGIMLRGQEWRHRDVDCPEIRENLSNDGADRRHDDESPVVDRQIRPEFRKNFPAVGCNVTDFGTNVPDFGTNVPKFAR